MPLAFGPINIDAPAGLWALLTLVPLIILYLIRPRPKPIAIPSLMFFLQQSGARKLTSFLKQFTHDWLFFIQLLALAALALTFANPFTNYQHDVTAQNTIIVLDVSASSQAYEGSKTRFELSVEKAKGSLGSKNTIILAKDIPLIGIKDTPWEEAAKYLQSLDPRETESRIGEAMILAGEALAGKEGRVVVISDFINTGGQDPQVAKAVLESKGIVVDFINTAQRKRSNVGIINLEADNAQSTVYVKNFDDAQREVTLNIGGAAKQLRIPAKGTETFSFATPQGVTKIELAAPDDLPVDNVAYLSAPAKGKARVMLISNNNNIFLKNALIASGEVDLILARPPVVPDEPADIYVIDSVDLRKLLPGTFEDIKKRVEEGASVIVHVQEDSYSIDYKGLLPVKLTKTHDGGQIVTEQLNQFTKNVEFGAVERVIGTEPLDDTMIIATVNKIPVIAYRPKGKGKSVYFGVLEKNTEFAYSPSYPIFWAELVKFLTEQQDVKKLNFKAGSTLLLDKPQIVKTPTQVLKDQSALVLDEGGLYQLEDRVIAVNLLNEQESNINFEASTGTKSLDYTLQPVKETRKLPWGLGLLALALILLLLEMLYVKWRGDL